MKAARSSIDWWGSALTCIRIAIVGTGHIFILGGRVLRVSGVVCEKLGSFARKRGKRSEHR